MFTLRLALGAAAALAIAACGSAVSNPFASNEDAAAPAASVAPTDLQRGVLSFADALEPSLDSVVRVVNFQEREGGLAPAGSGSGAVIDAERGLILTNAHVVDNGVAFALELKDRRRLEARLVGQDRATDIALLQVDPDNLKAIEVSEADDLRVGDVVFAVGYPLGLEQTLTFGVVSGLGRSTGSGLQDFIQTDAAINSGNSGGPLLDSRGRLIGVNTAILSQSGGNIGIGFSVPTAIALRVADQLAAYGEVRRGAIGVAIGPVTLEASAAAGIDTWDGALIAQVDAGSPAETAGLLPGDIIVSFDGREIRTPQSLRTAIGVADAGRPVGLAYIRGGELQNATVIPEPLQPPLVAGLSELGAAIRPLRLTDPVPTGLQGAWVREVAPGSPAALAGLRVGDVVVGVNRELVANARQCDRLVSESHGRAQLAVYRAGIVVPVLIDAA
ncbi:MAG: trypsin-like peptidase domain-containing protein [Pseudomonadota bacterium]